jgi:light-independent protochlorophyllide reductase subunit B
MIALPAEGDDRRRLVHGRADSGRSGRPGPDDGAADARSSRSICQAIPTRKTGARPRPSTRSSVQLADKDRKPAAAAKIGLRTAARQSARADGARLPASRRCARITRLLATRHRCHVAAPMGATPAMIARILGEADFNIVLYPEIAHEATRWLLRPSARNIPRPCRSASARPANSSPKSAPCRRRSKRRHPDARRMPWWSRSRSIRPILTGKRVFVFGDATHALAAARIARHELGFEVVGLGTYNREFARDIRDAAKLLRRRGR